MKIPSPKFGKELRDPNGYVMQEPVHCSLALKEEILSCPEKRFAASSDKMFRGADINP